jgi:hypothetical protein
LAVHDDLAASRARDAIAAAFHEPTATGADRYRRRRLRECS